VRLLLGILLIVGSAIYLWQGLTGCGRGSPSKAPMNLGTTPLALLFVTVGLAGRWPRRR
jgi:hypothetical protein